jgi:hypothetical protein
MRIEQEKKAYPDPEPSQLFEKNPLTVTLREA